MFKLFTQNKTEIVGNSCGNTAFQSPSMVHKLVKVSLFKTSDCTTLGNTCFNLFQSCPA